MQQKYSKNSQKHQNVRGTRVNHCGSRLNARNRSFDYFRVIVLKKSELRFYPQL
jgi:hypothetical protein